MSCAVLGARGLGLELVVLDLGIGVADRVLLAVVLEQLADQDALAGQFHLAAEVGAGSDAAPFRFLHKYFAQHHLVAGLLLDLGADFLAAALGLLDELVNARLGHGLAVDQGNVLGLGGQRQRQRQGQREASGEGCGRACGREHGHHGKRTFVGMWGDERRAGLRTKSRAAGARRQKACWPQKSFRLLRERWRR